MTVTNVFVFSVYNSLFFFKTNFSSVHVNNTFRIKGYLTTIVLCIHMYCTLSILHFVDLKFWEIPCLFNVLGDGGEQTQGCKLTFIKQPAQGMLRMAMNGQESGKKKITTVSYYQGKVDSCFSYPSTSLMRLRALLEVGNSASFCFSPVKLACNKIHA